MVLSLALEGLVPSPGLESGVLGPGLDSLLTSQLESLRYRVAFLCDPMLSCFDRAST